jgi:serine/threonine-protein kinase
MALVPGTRLGAYEVVGLLGAGGMGEVHRAVDTRLDRQVAIKVLPEAFRADPERASRFEREAKLLATLNHPNIAAIYGLEQADGQQFIVMELVEGETLAERIGRGPVPVPEALQIAKQIAEALEAAHEKGVIHRDLKPANVKLTRDEQVKVLDFGLAKAFAPDSETSSGALSNSPTVTSPVGATGMGVLLGTAAYMSPEQARGRAVDRRADIWAFGCVAYEMLTSRPAFDGADVSEVMASVIKSDVTWAALPANTPGALKRLIERCLRKDPRQRIRDVGDVRLALEELTVTHGAEPTNLEVLPALASAWQRTLPWAIASSAILVALGAIWSVWWRSAAPPRSVVRFAVDLGVDASPVSDFGSSLALSPDGTRLAFVARPSAGDSPRLYVRRLDQLAVTLLPGTENARNPFFSPDGLWIGFFANGQLKRTSVAGGAVVTVTDAADDRGGAWTQDGGILLTRGGPGSVLTRVPADGGSPQPFVTRGTDYRHRFPQMLPDGRGVLFTATMETDTDQSVLVQPLPEGPKKVLQRDAFYGRYVASGHLVFIRNGTLFAAPFDLDRLELTAQPVPILEEVVGDPTTGAHYAVADNGTLIYLSGSVVQAGYRVDWMNPDGSTQPLVATAGEYGSFEFSPDGRSLAIDVLSNQSVDVWIYDLSSEAMTRLTLDPREDRTPVWTSDGNRIAFLSRRDDAFTPNLYWQRLDATGTVQRLTESKNGQFPTSWHPSGRFLAFRQIPSGPPAGDIFILPVEGSEAAGWRPGKPWAFVESPFNETEATFSPDGRWVAYESNESGKDEIYVRPFPGPGGRIRVSTTGGEFPRWSRTGRALFYLSDRRLWVTDYSIAGGSFQIGKPRPWSDATFASRVALRTPNFALHPDGRVAGLQAQSMPADATGGKVVLVQNFSEELKRLVPTN